MNQSNRIEKYPIVSKGGKTRGNKVQVWLGSDWLKTQYCQKLPLIENHQ